MLRDVNMVASNICPCKVVYGTQQTNIEKLTEKDVKCYYKHVSYSQLKETDFKAKMRYITTLQLEDGEIWKTVYVNPFDLLVENRVIEMQYKILHRIIGTNRLLYKMGKRTSPNCDQCTMYPETIEHMFFECLIVKNFWFKLFEKYYEKKHIQVNANCTDILLYYNLDKVQQDVIVNILILYGKYYIYKCKMEMMNPEIGMYAKYMAFKLSIVCMTTCKYKNEYLELYEFVKSLL